MGGAACCIGRMGWRRPGWGYSVGWCWCRFVGAGAVGVVRIVVLTRCSGWRTWSASCHRTDHIHQVMFIVLSLARLLVLVRQLFPPVIAHAR